MKFSKILAILFLSPLLIFCITLKDKLLQAETQDFIVTSLDKNYTILAIKKKTNDFLVIDEICIPQNRIANLDLKKIDFREILKISKNEDENLYSSYITYLIDIKNDKLVNSYSYTRDAYLSNGSNFFMHKLFSLKMNFIKEENRRKIGPKPMGDEMDTRKLWSPMVKYDGILQKKMKMLIFKFQNC